MMLLSGAWWLQRLTGVAAQAIYVVTVVALVIGGITWLRHDARMDERNRLETKMANARIQELLLRQRRERDAAAVGARAEKELTKELDAADTIIKGLEQKLASRQGVCNPEGRPVCYPANVAKELNK